MLILLLLCYFKRYYNIFQYIFTILLKSKYKYIINNMFFNSYINFKLIIKINLHILPYRPKNVCRYRLRLYYNLNIKNKFKFTE